MEKFTCFLGLCIGLLDMTPKEQEEKNICTLDFSKDFIQNFCASKNTEENEKSGTAWEKNLYSAYIRMLKTQ